MVPKISDSLNLIIRLWIGIIFCYAGISKLLEPVENFRGAIAEYGLFPPLVNDLAAHIMPWLEFISGLFLILGYRLRVSAMVSALLSFSFVAMISATYLIYKKVPASCGCFGSEGIHLSPWQVILLDSLNFFMALYLFKRKTHFLSLDRWLA